MRGAPPVAAAAFLAATLVIGCGGGGGSGGSASDETIGKRGTDYVGKAVTQPGVSFKTSKIEPAEMPGCRKGNLEASLGEQKQDVPFYVSSDGRYLFRGEAVNLTARTTLA